MKRRLFALLAVCAVALSACAGMAISDPAPVIELERDLSAPAEAESFEAPEYEVVPFTSRNLVRSEDGKEVTLASYNYQTILLVLYNEGAVSPEDAAAAARNVEAFNAKMRTIHGELSEQGEALAGEAQEFYETFGKDSGSSAIWVGSTNCPPARSNSQQEAYRLGCAPPA